MPIQVVRKLEGVDYEALDTVDPQPNRYAHTCVYIIDLYTQGKLKFYLGEAIAVWYMAAPNFGFRVRQKREVRRGRS